MTEHDLRNGSSQKGNNALNLAVLVLLLAAILAGAYLRTIGPNWDEGRHLHPDERFLSMVLDSIVPVQSPAEYFNTEISTLNPANRGYDFFVYGTLPIFIIRYVGEWVGQVGYDPITIVGRQLSAYADILTILIVFVIGLRLYDKWAGLLAAAFYAFAVLPIQQSHFMTVDTFTNTFGMLTVLAAVILLTRPPDQETDARWFNWRRVWPHLFFGLGLGMATASKINAVSLALLLPLVEYVRARRNPRYEFKQTVLLVGLAGVVSIIVFRIFQPYAFNGPGFFNVGINENWWNSLRSLQAQATGEVDFPPALQWARRPFTFSITNLVVWGIGILFGIVAAGSLAAMGVKIFKRKQLIHLPIWAWTLFYFAWQGFAWVKSMRYLLLIYPLLAIIAGWGLWRLWQAREGLALGKLRLPGKVTRGIAIVVTLLSLGGTAAWGFAFSRIYTRPHTRVAASEWIYENIPGPINLRVETDTGEFTQPASYRLNQTLEPGQVYSIPFSADFDGVLSSVKFPVAQDLTLSDVPVYYSLDIISLETGQPLNTAPLYAQNLQVEDGTLQAELVFYPFHPIALQRGASYKLVLSFEAENSQVYLSGAPIVTSVMEDDRLVNQYLPQIVETITPDHAYTMDVTVLRAGKVTALELPFVMDMSQTPGLKTLRFTLSTPGETLPQTIISEYRGDLLDSGPGKGNAITVLLPEPLLLTRAQDVRLEIELVSGQGEIAIHHAAPVHESTWDDGLPTSTPGYVPYSDGGGIFRGDLNLELYWPDDAAKKERIYQALIQGDYLFISSNRQWGTTTRVPERYPLTTQYYRSLLGCPADQDVVTCYNLAEPGMYQGELGFELIKTSTSYPNLGDWEFNDQFAEEAFSVYDHPKVLIFKKSADFDSQKLMNVLDEVDLTKAIYLTPRQADDYHPEDVGPEGLLMLSEEELLIQQANGTWSDLFDRESLLNRYPGLAAAVFYVFALLIGLAVFSLVSLAMPGLADKGYPFARLIGLMLFGYLAFLLGSNRVAITRASLAYILLAMVVLCLLLAWFVREKLADTFKKNWKQFLVEEAVTLIAFGFFLWVRYQNPDLWHPWRGGEKPMDFSHLNAVIKSTTFPAYDPWFAGGYINYYYYGQILVGMPIKLLGVIPAVGYNIMLPLWYAMLVGGAFSVGWNLATALGRRDGQEPPRKLFGFPFWAGLLTAALLAFLGNLGEAKLLGDAFKTLGSGGLPLDGAGFGEKITWLFKGIGEALKGATLPISEGSWYWNPSRTIPGEAITEFPYFTYLYGDLHAHLIAMPIVVLAVGWGLSVLLHKEKWAEKKPFRWLGIVFALFVGALVIGALRPTNTWDYYTFTILNFAILAYVGWKYIPPLEIRRFKPWMNRLLIPLCAIVVLFVLAQVMYAPFNNKFIPGFSEIGLWSGEQTPISSYLTHWGLILFVIAFWFAWETYAWMERTRLSEVRAWAKYRNFIYAALIGLAVVLAVLLLRGIGIALIALPLGAWALALLLLPGQSDVKKLMFFMAGTGLLLTIVVELVHLVGDIGRMNVVFKLYLQTWLLLTLVAGTGLAILWQDQVKWRLRSQLIFQIPLTLLVVSALLFPVFATRDKITDRMSLTAPQGLDGMKYMESSVFNLNGIDMDLGQDYRAIQWMQDNIEGSPVILEAQAYEYYWGNRYTIYTGLPGVVGWNYHQRQQRAVLRSEIVQQRVDSVNAFYLSFDRQFIVDYLEQYQVKYIVVGQQEMVFYPADVLTKFELYNGVLWDEVYAEGETKIYEVR